MKEDVHVSTRITKIVLHVFTGSFWTNQTARLDVTAMNLLDYFEKL